MSELGDYLRYLRGDMSLREASERSNGRVSFAAISQAEKGINSHGKPYIPTTDTLKGLARIYGVSPNKLMAMAGYVDVHPEYHNIVIADDYIKVYGEIHAGEAVRNDAPFETNHSMICNVVLAHHINMPIWTHEKSPTPEGVRPLMSYYEKSFCPLFS